MTRLVVWCDTDRVGVLDTTTTNELRFTYDAEVATTARANPSRRSA